MVINKKIKRTMLESKSQYFGSLALIIISCLLYTMFNMLSYNLANITSSFGENYKQEDANFMTDKPLTNLSEIETRFNISIEEGGSFDYSVSEDKVIRVFTENSKINIPAIIKGKALSGSDILIDPAYAKANKLNLGDDIKIYDKTLKISGFMSLPNYIYPLKSEGDILSDPNNFGVAVIKNTDLSTIKRLNSFYSIKFNGDKSNLENQISDFKVYLKGQDISILSWTLASSNPRITLVTTKLNGINKMSTSAPIVILLLTCILCGIVMWRMIKREAVIMNSLFFWL